MYFSKMKKIFTQEIQILFTSSTKYIWDQSTISANIYMKQIVQIWQESIRNRIHNIFASKYLGHKEQISKKNYLQQNVVDCPTQLIVPWCLKEDGRKIWNFHQIYPISAQIRGTLECHPNSNLRYLIFRIQIQTWSSKIFRDFLPKECSFESPLFCF